MPYKTSTSRCGYYNYQMRPGLHILHHIILAENLNPIIFSGIQTVELDKAPIDWAY